jgi:hypothetical protein
MLRKKEYYKEEALHPYLEKHRRRKKMNELISFCFSPEVSCQACVP